jgi:hypothetical protein
VNDAELIETFEACRITAAEFRHEMHVRLTYAYLSRHPLPIVMSKLGEGLRRFAAHHGVPEKYHETITFAFAALINERRLRTNPGATFEAFRANNPDLFEKTVLEAYYRPETLESADARAFFVMPDRGAGMV